MKVGIVGAGGYLGNSLQKCLLENEIDFVKLGREIDVETNVADLDLIIDAAFPRDVFKKKVFNDYLQNLNLRLDLYRNNDIPYIYFGSLSSNSPISSKYGSAKGISEDLVRSLGGKVIRFGLVVSSTSPGGRYLEIIEALEKLPFLFLPDSTFFPIGVTRLDDLMETVMDQIVQKEIEFEDYTAKVTWTNLNLLISGISEKKSFTFSPKATSVICKLITILPLGKFDNLKAIAFKNQSFND